MEEQEFKSPQETKSPKPSSRKKLRDRITSLKIQLDSREAELEEMKAKYETSLTKGSYLLCGIREIQALVTRHDLDEEGRIYSLIEGLKDIANAESFQTNSEPLKESSSSSTLVCEVCQKNDHKLEDCSYIKEARKRNTDSNNEENQQEETKSSNNKEKNGQSPSKEKYNKVNRESVERGVTDSDDEFEEKNKSKNIPAFASCLPKFPLTKTKQLTFGSKVCSPVVITAGAMISTMSLAEAIRLELKLIIQHDPIKIFYEDDTFTVSRHSVRIQTESLDKISTPFNVTVVKKQAVPLILGLDWVFHN